MNRIGRGPVTFVAVAWGIASSACSTTGAKEAEWQPVTCFESRGAIERVRCGRPDPADPGLQAVSVDQAGDVALIHFENGVPRPEVVYQNGGELTGIAIGDVDPATPGVELYVGGCTRGDTSGESGAVFQVTITPGASSRIRVREIYTGPAYVHSVETVEPQHAGDVWHLLVSTYRGEIHLLTPGAGPWQDRTLYRDPTTDPDAVKAKDAGLLKRFAGGPRHEALVALKGGRLIYVDLAHPESARVVHEEPGGLSRVTPDSEDGAFVTGYAGRLLHFTRSEDGFRFEVLAQEGVDSGLRGAVLGDFPAGHTMSHLTVFGFHKRCRALVPRNGVLDPVTLYVDVDRGHTIEAADLVPGNDADELLIGGYSKRVTMLVVR